MDIRKDMTSICFLMEDSHGPTFIKNFVRKKQAEGMFSDITQVEAFTITISSKLTRIALGVEYEYDKIIVMVDADGRSVSEKRDYVMDWISNSNASPTIVVFRKEIEEWICYSMGLDPGDDKPSHFLKHRIRYKKNRLGKFANKIECVRLERCDSFCEFISAMG